MPIIRKKLAPSEVYPDDIRYNPTTGEVESNINGDWVANPEADPRHQTTFPPRLTSDPKCDAAQSVVDALKGQIDSVIVAIDNASTAFTIAGLILGLFSFGVFAIFISIALFIADQMIAAGSTALEAALTPAVYDTLKCILYCHMDNQGRITADGLEAAKADVTAQIGGLGAVILNQMLSLAGEGGVNNLASLGTSTGDCSLCNCGDCTPDGAFIIHGTLVGTGNDGTYNYIDIQSENVTYLGTTAQWAVYGSLTANFCCYYHDNQVLSGSISSGSRINCEGGTTGDDSLIRRVEFYSATGVFIMRYRFYVP